MIIPLRGLEPSRYTSFPIMTLSIIALNILVLIGQFLLEGFNLGGYISLFSSVPKFVINQQAAGALATITAIFMHAGLFHLGSNMIFLWAFAQRVEDACGPWRFLAFYLTCGVVADIISTMSRSTETIPGVGASGAVYGIMAAYLILYPREKVRILIFLVILAKLRAYWVILFFFLNEIPNALDVLLFNKGTMISHWAHLGGFFAGTLIFLFLRPDAYHRFRNDLPL
ncbi:MAG: rhomboid family intramembrane serine protease [Chloroflexi bacterium]|nr:rhomboid family intramembrane serine protease [Chloroflexota bacterium]